MADKKQEYAENGVLISKSPAYVGDKITIEYNGLLAQSGANVVYIHAGYGDEWEGKYYTNMEYDGGVFKTTIDAAMTGVLNFAFKDSAENWDNNSTNNYSVKVTKKAARAAKAAEEKASEKVVVKKAASKSKTADAKESPADKKASAKKTTETKKTVRKTAKKSESEV